jgi:monofunctional biosynthetic peptidoglycan transglycosylase
VTRLYFNKSAAQITAHDSATIAAPLPNSLRFNSAKPTPYIEQRCLQIQRLMRNIGKVDLTASRGNS